MILNEVGTQDIDFVELFNFGDQALSIQGYTLEFYSDGVLDFEFTLPDRILQPNSGVLEVSDLNVPALNRIYAGQDIDWNATTRAAVVLRNASDEILDFWLYAPSGGAALTSMINIPEIGSSVSLDHLPAIGNLVDSHQRSLAAVVPGGMGINNWAVRPPSRGVENVDNLNYNPLTSVPAPQVIINEVDPNTPDFVELFNHGCEAVDVAGYTLEFFSEFQDSFIYVLPSIELLPNETYVALTDTVSDAGPDSFYVGDNLNWVSFGGYAVVLRNANGKIIDFVAVAVQLDQDNAVLPPQLKSLPGPVVKTGSVSDSIQRIARTNRGNNYYAEDWTRTTASEAAANAGQVLYPESACADILEFLPAIISGANNGN